jgi:uncharacterized protein (TIGR00288 family)
VAGQSDNANMAVFCDFENIAIGVRQSKHTDFDINKVMERLLLKGSIVVKKAYCDWSLFKEFKPRMHEAAFEMIEIPHPHQVGKNSADIRLVVDALDLCYTKPHVDTFVILSGDSDFSPLVSKLRENNKKVIGVGVKDSTSDLLTANCDDFIFYDDLVRKEEKRKRQPVKPRAPRKKGTVQIPAKKDDDVRLQHAFDLIVETIDMLIEERGEEETLWGSMVKQAIKRRKPGFNESYYGFRAFSQLLVAAEKQGLVELELDERSGGYKVRAVYSED